MFLFAFCTALKKQSPEHVKDLSVRFDSEEDVWHGHVLELSFFGIGKIDFRFPDSLRIIYKYFFDC